MNNIKNFTGGFWDGSGDGNEFEDIANNAVRELLGSGSGDGDDDFYF
jgi:hypothetical protein